MHGTACVSQGQSSINHGGCRGRATGRVCDCGKVEVQKLADETGMRIAVCHFPPGTSKWNKIEHRLFSFISQNWRGKPLLSFEVIVNLIAATTTVKGLKVHADVDERRSTLLTWHHCVLNQGDRNVIGAIQLISWRHCRAHHRDAW